MHEYMYADVEKL